MRARALRLESREQNRRQLPHLKIPIGFVCVQEESLTGDSASAADEYIFVVP